MSHVLRRRLSVKDISLDYRNRSIVVSVEVSISYGKADGTVTRTEHTQSQQVLPLGKYTEDDIPALTEDLLGNCKLIHPSKKPLIEQLLRDLLNPSQTASALQSPPTIKYLPIYLEALYESPANKLKATQKLIAVLSEASEATVLAVVQNEALLGALARVARESQMADAALTGNIIEIFSLIKVHPGLAVVLKDLRVMELCMRLLRLILDKATGRQGQAEVVLDSDSIRSAIRGQRPGAKDRRDKPRASGTNSPASYASGAQGGSGIGGSRLSGRLLSVDQLEMLTKILQLLSSVREDERDFCVILDRYSAAETVRDIVQALYALGYPDAFMLRSVLKRVNGGSSSAVRQSKMILKAVTFAIFFLFKLSTNEENRRKMNPSGVIFNLIGPCDTGDNNTPSASQPWTSFTAPNGPTDPPTSIVFVVANILSDMFGTTGQIFTQKDLTSMMSISPFTASLHQLVTDPVTVLGTKSSSSNNQHASVVAALQGRYQSIQSGEGVGDVARALQLYKEETGDRRNKDPDDETSESLNLFVLLTVNSLKLLFNLSIDSDRENIHLVLHQVICVLHRLVQVLSTPTAAQDLLESPSIQQISTCLLTELVKIIYNSSVDFVPDVRVQRLKDILFRQGLLSLGITDTILGTARGGSGASISLESLLDIQGLTTALRTVGSPITIKLNPQPMDPRSLSRTSQAAKGKTKELFVDYFPESDVFQMAVGSTSDPVAFINLNRTLYALKKEFVKADATFYDQLMGFPGTMSSLVSVSDYDQEDLVRTHLQLCPSSTAAISLGLFRLLNAVMQAKTEKPSNYGCFDQNAVISLCAVLINLMRDTRTKLFVIAASTKTSTSGGSSGKADPTASRKILVYSQLIHQLTSYTLNPTVVSSSEWQGINGLFVKLLASVADYNGHKYIFDQQGASNQQEGLMEIDKDVQGREDSQYITKITIGDYFIHYVKKVISMIVPELPATFGYIKILALITRTIEYTEDFNGPQNGDDTLRVNINNTKYTLGALETLGALKSLSEIAGQILDNNTDVILELRTKGKMGKTDKTLYDKASDPRGIARLNLDTSEEYEGLNNSCIVDSDVLLDIVVVVVSYLRLVVAHNIIMGKKKERAPDPCCLRVLATLLNMLILINGKALNTIGSSSKQLPPVCVIEPELFCHVVYGLYQYFTLNCSVPEQIIISQLVHNLALTQELCSNFPKNTKDLSSIVIRTLGLIDEKSSEDYRKETRGAGGKVGPSLSHFNSYNYMFVQKLKESGML